MKVINGPKEHTDMEMERRKSATQKKKEPKHGWKISNRQQKFGEKNKIFFKEIQLEILEMKTKSN